MDLCRDLERNEEGKGKEEKIKLIFHSHYPHIFSSFFKPRPKSIIQT